MKSITINFSRTYNETLKAWLMFSRSSKVGKFWHRFSFPVFSIIMFLIFLYQSRPFTGSEFSSGEKSHPSISLFLYLCMPVTFSLASGWVISVIAKIVKENSIAKQIQTYYPPESFGEMTVILSQDKLSVHAPLFDVQYHWNLLDSILVTQEYLFICSGKGIGQRLVSWIPLSALGSQSTNIISSVEKWLRKSEQS